MLTPIHTKIQLQLATALQGDQGPRFAMTFPRAMRVRDLLDELMEQGVSRHNDAFAHCMVIINGRCVADRDAGIHDGDTVFLLSPISGG